MKLLDVRIDELNQSSLESKIRSILGQKKLHHIATVNPEFLVEAQKNETFKSLLNKTDLNICDGAGIAFWTKILYNKKAPRTPGVELAEIICKIAAQEKKSIYFLGGFGVAKDASKAMKLKHTDLIIAGAEDGETNSMNNNITQSAPDIIFVAFGAPKQEIWIDEYAKEIPNLTLAIGLGGTFDFWAGKVKRAPLWMQKLGIEWVYRLCQEPIKRSKRIWNATVIFSLLVLKDFFRKS